MTLRNTIHDRLTDHFGRADWWASTSLLLDDITAEMLTEIVRKHQRKDRQGHLRTGKGHHRHYARRLGALVGTGWA